MPPIIFNKIQSTKTSKDTTYQKRRRIWGRVSLCHSTIPTYKLNPPNSFLSWENANRLCIFTRQWSLQNRLFSKRCHTNNATDIGIICRSKKYSGKLSNTTKSSKIQTQTRDISSWRLKLYSFEKANDITTFTDLPVFIHTKQHELLRCMGSGAYWQENIDRAKLYPGAAT